MKSILVFLLGGVLLLAAASYAGSVYSSGEIDDDLNFEDFQIADGYLTGFIVNASKRVRPAVKLDVWTTNTMETRIYWRKTLNFGDLAPGTRVVVKEPYTIDQEDLTRTKFMFRTPLPANYRNQAGQTTESTRTKQATQQKETSQSKQGAVTKQAAQTKQGSQSKQAAQTKQGTPAKQGTHNKQAGQPKQGTQADPATQAKPASQVKDGTQAKRTQTNQTTLPNQGSTQIQQKKEQKP